MNITEIRHLQALWDATTKASRPWYADWWMEPDGTGGMVERERSGWIRAGHDEVDDTFITGLNAGMTRADAEFVAAAHTAMPDLLQQLIDQANQIHRLEHKIAKLHDTIHELKESTRSATSGEESSSDDTE